MRQVWREDVKILIIDEISFFKTGDMERLNRQLENQTGRRKIFGGISIIFSGGFHQLKPICSKGEVLYSGSASATAWEQALNCAIFLNNSHRFKDNPEYGMILERMRMGEDRS
jgi:thymidine kinase